MNSTLKISFKSYFITYAFYSTKRPIPRQCAPLMGGGGAYNVCLTQIALYFSGVCI